LKTISFSNFLKSKFESNQIKNTDVIHQNFFQKVLKNKNLSKIKSKIPVLFIKNFFQKVVGAILYLFSGKLKKITKNCIFPLKFLHCLAPGSVSGSGFPIWMRIHKVTESGSNPDPDPQLWFVRHKRLEEDAPFT
jgi:hypothetical protein